MRWRAAVAAAVAVAAVLALLLRDPYDGLEHVVVKAKPSFNLLVSPAAKRVAPQDGELLRLHARRARQDILVTVAPLTLPAYEGAASGILPVYATNATRDHVTGESRDLLRAAPGYRIATTGSAADGLELETVTLYAVPEDGARDGVVVTFRQTKPAGGLNPGGRRLAQTMKSALSSFQFGTDRA